LVFFLKKDNLLVLELLKNIGSLGAGLVDVSDHEEGSLRKVVVLSVQNLLEGADGIGQLDKLARETSENLGGDEGLGKELLDLAGTLDGDLVLLGKLVHTQDGNDILERFVVLKDLLDAGGSLVVLISNNAGVQHAGLGVEGIDGGVDSQFGNRAGKHSGGIQVGEGGGRGRIGQVIGRHVDSLDGGNRSLLGGGNALLHETHIGGKGGLVSDGGRNTSQKGRHLRSGLGEAENVVNEKKHVLSLLVTEVFGNGKGSKGDTGTGTRGLVHLSIHEGSLN